MRRPRSNRHAGSAVLLALLVVFAASFVLAGWAMMLAGRTVSSEEASVAQKRRISYQNARNIGMQWARHGLGGNAITNVTVTLTNDWGQFSAASVASNILNTSIVDSRVNHFSPMPSVFTLPVSTTLVGAGVTNSNTFFFRSRSPVFGGYPLVAQTNTLGFTTNFSRISVATNGNGMALMYAQPGALSTAPASTVYNSSVARTVANALGSSFPAPVSAYPFTPIVSAPTGTNSTSGLLTAPPPRTFTINALRAGIDSAFGTNALPVTDQGSFRIIGTLSGFEHVVHYEKNSGSARKFLLVNTIPGATLTPISSNRYTLVIGSNSYTISISGGWLRFTRGGNNQTLTGSSQYLRILSTGGNAAVVSKTDVLTLTDTVVGGTSRFVGFELTDSEMVALQDRSATGNGKLLIFTPEPPAPSGSPLESKEIDRANTPGFIVEGAVIYKRNQYGTTPINFMLMGQPLNTIAYNALNRIPNPGTLQYRIRALVGGLPLVQIIGSNRTLTFRDTGGANFLNFNPTASQKLTVLPESVDRPALIHVEQDAFGSDANLEWRKVLVVYDAENALNVASSSSTLTFSYPDPGDFDVAFEGSSNNTRPLLMSIVGRVGFPNTASRFVGGGGRNWNLGMTLRDSPATFELGANQTLRLIGGIRSNSRVEATPGTSAVVLERNTNPGALELFSDRMGWIETWQQ